MSDGVVFFQQVGGANRIAVSGLAVVGEWDSSGVCWVLTDDPAYEVHRDWSYREWMGACRAAAAALPAES